MPDNIKRKASFSRCQTYRYSLSRQWDADKPAMLYIGLNPSTADHRVDDPTIRRCIGLARFWGYGACSIANLFSYRATFPSDLKKAHDPVGPRTNSTLKRLAGEHSMILLMWGNHGLFQQRDQQVLKLLQGYKVSAIGTTKQGAPRHVLYARRDALHTPFN